MVGWEARQRRAVGVLTICALAACGVGSYAQTPNSPPSRKDGPPADAPRQGGLLGGAPPPTAPPPAPRSEGRLDLGPTSPQPAGRATAMAPRVSVLPTLDGLLDDEIWSQAVRLTRFVQRSPVEGAAPTEATEVFIAYDSTNLYMGFYAHYSDAGLIRANRSDRDQLGLDDTISVYFDPFLDQQRAYVFTVNGYGVQGDSILGGGLGGFGGGGFGGGGGGGPGGVPRGDPSWDALFDSAGMLVSDGWTAEIAIPFKSLRYPARGSGESHRWGFQIARTIGGKNESIVWAPLSRAVASFLGQMGVLQGMEDLSTSRNLEILPTFTAIQLGSLNTASGAFIQNDIDPEAGVSVKYGVTSDLIADFTFNPDFSQIESDQPQIDVNQRFPLFFAELRPFFLEGQEVFGTRGNVNLLHTRTIIDPRYGAKLTGKLAGLSVGVLVANDEAPGKVESATDPAFEQAAQFVVSRVRYDLFPGSYLGAILTDREFLDSYSRVGGFDGKFRLGRTDDLEFRLANSWTRGEDGVERTGATYDVALRHNGRSFDYGFNHDTVEPGFATATGFVLRTNTRRTRGNVGYRWWPENRVLNNLGPDLTYERNYNFDGDLDDEDIGLSSNVQFASNIRINAGVNRDMERYLGVDFRKWRRNVFAQVSTNRRVSIFAGMNWGDQIRYVVNPFLGRGRGGSLFLNLVPFSRLRSRFSINYSRLDDPRDGSEVFNIKIFRSQTTYQFTGRLLVRNILEYDTLERTFDANLLLTYRVNAGTVFFVGYDDHYQQADRLNAPLFATNALRQTNRAFFTKLSYLFRY